MIRSFLALSLPDTVSDQCMDLQSHVRNARWIDDDSFHITLAFLGSCTHHELSELDALLSGLRMNSFPLTLKNVGAFGGAKPRLLYAGVAESEPLRRLQAKIERAARESGIDVESRKFIPHVTLARCGGGVIPAQALDWTTRHSRFTADTFNVHHFTLFRSVLGTGAPVYSEMTRYELL